MPKPPSLLIHLDRSQDTSLQTQLTLSLKRLVQTGILSSGKLVPSSRELARDLGVSRNTVSHAYDRLIGEGYFEASPRRGLFVSQFLRERKLRNTRLPAKPNLSSPVAFRQTVDLTAHPVPFSPCQPDVRLFPLPLWNRLRARSLRSHGMSLLNYQSQLPLGLPHLRRVLASYLSESRGVRCDWRQIAITTGSQQALYLLAQILLKPGCRVAVEDPGYLGARAAWKRAGAALQPVPVDSEGMRVPGGSRFTADLVYVTPSRQFPTGACLSLPRRLSLVELARKTRTWVVEDDYDSEFRYSRPPLPSLQSLDSSGRVIYVGSMSKVLFPALRIGYVVLPATLVEDFSALRSALDEHGPLIDQAALAEFIDGGYFHSHIRRCRTVYAERLETLLRSASNSGLPLSFPHTDGGMNLAGLLPQGMSDEECSQRLQQCGMEIPALSRYALRRSRPGLVFGFTAFEPNAIRESITSAAGTLQKMSARGPGLRD